MTEVSGILIFLVIFLLGGIIGFAICRITLGAKQIAARQQELDNTKAELEQYKSQVKKHFTNSAELMEQVANSYQALYKHMAGQSQNLLNSADTDVKPFPQLKMPSEKEDKPAAVKDVQPETTKQAAPETQAAGAKEETAKRESQSSEIVSKQKTTKEAAPEAAGAEEETAKTESQSSETVSKQKTTKKAAPEAAGAEEETAKTESQSSEPVSESSTKESSQKPHSNN